MNVRGTFAPKLLLCASLAIVIILAAVGLLLFARLLPRKDSVTFSFAGWTNDAPWFELAFGSVWWHNSCQLVCIRGSNAYSRAC